MCVFDPDPSSFLATFASWPPDSLYLSPTAVLFRALNKPNSFPLEIPGICCFFWWEVLRSFSAFLLLTLSYPWISAHTHSLRIFFTVHHDHIHSLWPFSYCFLVFEPIYLNVNFSLPIWLVNNLNFSLMGWSSYAEVTEQVFLLILSSSVTACQGKNCFFS